MGKKGKGANIVIGNEDEDNIVPRLNNRTSNKELRKALCVVCQNGWKSLAWHTKNKLIVLKVSIKKHFLDKFSQLQLSFGW